MKIFLLPLSLLYGCITWLRNKLYDWGILSSHQFSIPVISVGNLSMGGTGKTPHVEYLIRLYKDQYAVAVLSRGYKRNTTGFYEVTGTAPYIECGDEPLQYKKKFPDIRVFVDEDRMHGIEQILEKYPDTGLILLDDAFQHRAVKPKVNILLTEYDDLFVHDFMVPAGRLREFACGSKRADVIIVTKSPEQVSAEEKKSISEKLKANPSQAIYFSTMSYGLPQPVFGEKEIDPPDSVLLVTGIANPKPFLQFLKQRYKNVQHLVFPDHHAFTKSDIINIKDAFKDLAGIKKMIITTEKDAVRLMGWPADFHESPLFYWPVEVKFDKAPDNFL